jgi:serine/threonine protein kinase
MVVAADGCIKLVDFGFAKLLCDNSRTFTNCGTCGYTAPEVIKGEGYGVRADVWSFGILLCELISGELPFENSESPFEI